MSKVKIITTLLFTIFLLNTNCVFSQVQGNYEKERLISKEKDTLNYRIQNPLNAEKDKKYPLIVFLHGMGSRGADNERPLKALPPVFKDSLNTGKYPCYVLVPQCPKNDVWVNFPDFPKSLIPTDKPTLASQLTLDLIHKLIETKNVDPQRIYITGLSMGGEGTFDMLIRKPDLFACAVPICSVSNISKACLIKDIPTWIFHGSKDNINDVKYSRLMYEAMKKCGGSPKYTEYPDLKHNSWDRAYSEPDLLTWMFKQKSEIKK